MTLQTCELMFNHLFMSRMILQTCVQMLWFFQEENEIADMY